MSLRLHLHTGRSVQLFAVLLFAAALFIGATASARATTVAQASRTCSITKVYNELGPTYVEKIAVTRTTCGAGEKVIKDYNACRISTGGVKGRCKVRVDGFKCTEQRDSGPIQFEAAVTCAKARQAVDFTYSEDT